MRTEKNIRTSRGNIFYTYLYKTTLKAETRETNEEDPEFCIYILYTQSSSLTYYKLFRIYHVSFRQIYARNFY